MVTDPDSQQRQGRVTELSAPTPDVRIVRLRLDGAPLQFAAGQYARLWFDGMPARDYSLGNVPGAEELEFHIRINAERGVGRYVGSHLKKGESVTVAGPYGDAYLRDGHAGPVLAVAGGTGVVPIKAIVEAALRRGFTRPLHLYLGARTAEDLYLESHFRALAGRHPNLQVTDVVSDPAKANGKRTGNVSDAIGQDFASVQGFKAYVAGPPAMVAATERVLKARGLSAADIHADPFVPGDHHSAGIAAAQ